MSQTSQTTIYLERASRGDDRAAELLLPLVYRELRALARKYMRRERANHTLQPTALVHEAYIRLVNEKQVDWRGKTHFFAIGARCMRQILINHAKRVGAHKRGGGCTLISIHDADAPIHESKEIDVLALDEVLQRLVVRDERQSRVVELKIFGGLTTDEIAEVLGVSPGTVKGDWRFARAWLRSQLKERIDEDA